MLKLKSINETIQGNIIYMLILVVLVQTIYPITLRGGVFLIGYQLLYAAMFAVGVYISRDSWWHVIVTGSLALLFLIFGIAFALDPESTWKINITYLFLAPYLAVVTYVLLRYIFLAKEVTRDVLYAATAVYMLLGAAFVPIYGLLEAIKPGSFIDGSNPGIPIQWQQLIYFSYTTLTTAGYGDVLPILAWARSLASVESIVGVLYIAVMMARLVGVYSSKQETVSETILSGGKK